MMGVLIRRGEETERGMGRRWPCDDRDPGEEQLEMTGGVRATQSLQEQQTMAGVTK